MTETSTYGQESRRIVRNTVLLFGRMLFVLLVSLYATRVAMKVLGASDYGVQNVVCGFVSLFGFINVTLSNGIQRFYNYSLGKAGKDGAADVGSVYTAALLIQLAVIVVVVLLCETFGLWYLNHKMVIPVMRMPAARVIFHLSVLSLVFVLLQVPYSSAVMAYEKMDFYALISVADAVLKLAILFYLPYAPFDRLILYASLYTMISLLDFALFFIYCKRRFSLLKLSGNLNRSLFGNMLSFSGWNVLGTFAYALKGQGVNVLLNSFFGTLINAANGVATQVMNAISGFSSNIVIAFRPQLVQSYAKGDHGRTRTLMYSLSKVSYLFLLMVSLPVMSQIDLILDVWLDGIVPEYTRIFVMLSLVTMLISSFNAPVTQVIHAVGKMRKYQIVTSIIICLVIPVSYIFLRLGCEPQVVYWVGIAVVAVNQAASMAVLKELFEYGIADYMRSVMLPCALVTLLSLAAYLVVGRLCRPTLVSFLISCAAIALTVAASSYFIALDRNEKTMFKSIIFRRNK